MPVLFFDSSALAKRYMPEIGTKWVRQNTASRGGNDIAIAQITPVEIYSAISRQYHDSYIDLRRLQAFRKLMARHIHEQYLVITLSDTITQNALTLQEKYRLRAYDAVQLASAQVLNTRLRSTAKIVFVVADNRLLAAAISEGLTTDNPNTYA
ncbi:MAG: type II toxin-antitoxin system VapC family toxin [Aggregatilineales bacterium]